MDDYSKDVEEQMNLNSKIAKTEDARVTRRAAPSNCTFFEHGSPLHRQHRSVLDKSPLALHQSTLVLTARVNILRASKE